MAVRSVLPGLAVQLLRPPTEESPLRTDVAGFIGRTRRGPVGVPVRVAGGRDFSAVFGGLDARWATGYSVRGYVANGGQVAHVVRLPGAGGAAAAAVWAPADVVGVGFGACRYRIAATDPGTWADDTRVFVSYRANGLARRHELAVRVEVPGEEPELFTGIAPDDLASALTASRFVRFIPDGPGLPDGPADGPTVRVWDPVALGGGADPVPDRADYLTAVAALGDVTEVALVAAPDLHADLGGGASDVLEALLRDASERQDRLILVDLPPAVAEPAAWASGLAGRVDGNVLRAGAAYHPWVRVLDPLGSSDEPLRDVPPSGHIAGMASRLDRERGPQHTPANALLADAVDLTSLLTEPAAAAAYAARINPLRCRPGRGLEVWGGRTLDPHPLRRFVAHRRLLHRLVRAIRRVAEPLVFEPNGPPLWLALARGVTSVLLEAWRAGGLAGATRAEAFEVRCDERTNPPESIDGGQVVCEIDLAPAAPMEFITLRLTVAPQGQLEVVEA